MKLMVEEETHTLREVSNLRKEIINIGSIDKKSKSSYLFMVELHQINDHDKNYGWANDSSLSNQLKVMFPKVFSEHHCVPLEE